MGIVPDLHVSGCRDHFWRSRLALVQRIAWARLVVSHHAERLLLVQKTATACSALVPGRMPYARRLPSLLQPPTRPPPIMNAETSTHYSVDFRPVVDGVVGPDDGLLKYDEKHDSIEKLRADLANFHMRLQREGNGLCGMVIIARRIPAEEVK